MGMLGCVRDSDGAIEEPVAKFCDDSHENSVVYAKVNFLTSLAKASLLCIELPSLCYFTYLRFIVVLYDYLSLLLLSLSFFLSYTFLHFFVRYIVLSKTLILNSDWHSTFLFRCSYS